MSRPVEPKTVIVYQDENGNEPYLNWLESIKGKQTKARIQIRVRRLQNGLYGDCQTIGEGVFELRLFFGSGYRVYFGQDDDRIIILLCGGDKSTQKKDIKTAQIYWKDYQSNG